MGISDAIFLLINNAIVKLQVVRVQLPWQKKTTNTVNDLFSAQCAKERLFLFNIWWKKFPFKRTHHETLSGMKYRSIR